MTESRDKTCIDNDGQCLQLSFGSLFTFSLIFIFVVVVVVVVAVVVCQNWHGLAGCFIYFSFFTEFFCLKMILFNAVFLFQVRFGGVTSSSGNVV